MKAKLTSKYILFVLIFTQVSISYTFAEAEIDEHSRKYKESCEYNKTLVEQFYFKNSRYEIDCHRSYHHYNARAYKKYYTEKASKVRVSNFNVWHPGKSNTRFKDYKLVASIINRFDITAALELLAPVGEDNKINKRVVSMATPLAEEVKSLRIELNKTSDIEEKISISKNISAINKKLKELSKTYKKPGYMKLFEELKRLDASWSLIISPKGEASKKSDVQELTGFFYRSRVIRPMGNPYCKEFVTKVGSPWACIPHFSISDMGKNMRDSFSRRPFLASFVAGKFDFMILASHVVFNSPTNKEKRKEILNNSFGVDDLKDFENNKGIDSRIYARFAEVKMTVDFMKMLATKYTEKDVIFAGDFNLEKKNPFWKQVIGDTPFKLLISDKTSLTERKYVDGRKTNGLASNYDHFLFDTEEVSECDQESAKVFDFISDRYVRKRFAQQYIVRRPDPISGVLYEIVSNAESMIEEKIEIQRSSLENEKEVLRGKIVKRYNKEEIEKSLYDYKSRIFGTQLSDFTFYRVFKEVVSDHAPIHMNCSTK